MPETVKAHHKGLGVKYGGICPLCTRSTGNRPFEREVTSLYKGDDGKFYAVHPRCAGGETKSSNGVKYRTEPKETIEIEVQP